LSEQAVIGKRHTIVIPKSIRSRLNLEEGQRIIVRVEDGRIVIEPLPKDPYKILGEIIGEPYNESKDEKKVERWLKKHAYFGH